MDLKKKKVEIEKRVEEINEERVEVYKQRDELDKQLGLSAQEFLRLDGELRLIDEMLVETPATKQEK